MALLEFSFGGTAPEVDPARSALLLDIDGTLLDIAQNPDAVSVPAELPAVLARLKLCFGGAVALISGRPLSQIDQIFPGTKLHLVGCHGAEIRFADGTALKTRVDPLPQEFRERIAQLGADMPEILVEDKIYSVALHYRDAPEKAAALLAALRVLCGEAKEPVELLHGKSVIEVTRAEIDKGRAVRALFEHIPFKGRTPLFIGDDVTDEAAFAVLSDFSGIGISVGRRILGAAHMFATPGEVRRYLHALASRGECLP